MDRLLRECCCITSVNKCGLFLQPPRSCPDEVYYAQLAVYAHLGMGSTQLGVLDAVDRVIPHIRSPPRPKQSWVDIEESVSFRNGSKWLNKSAIAKLCLGSSPASVLYNTPPSSPSTDEGESSTTSESVMDFEPTDHGTVFSSPTVVTAAPADSVCDSPLFVEIDLKAMLAGSTNVCSIHLNRIPAVISACIAGDDTLGLSSGDQGDKALSCLRVVQYERVTDGNGYVGRRPRLLRFHYPYIFMHPFDRSRLLSCISKVLNEECLMGLRKWQCIMRGIVNVRLGKRVKPLPVPLKTLRECHHPHFGMRWLS